MKRPRTREVVIPMKRRRPSSKTYTPLYATRQLNPGYTPDYKQWHAYWNPGGVTSTGGVTSLNTDFGGTTLGRGDDCYQNFQGSTINPTGIRWRLVVTGATGNALLNADVFNKLRFMVFQWNDDSVPTISAATTGVLQFSSTTSGKSVANQTNLIVLVDKLVCTFAQTDAAAQSSSTCEVYEGYIKAKKIAPIIFTPGSVSYKKGGLFALALSDSAVAPNPNIVFECQIMFSE